MQRNSDLAGTAENGSELPAVAAAPAPAGRARTRRRRPSNRTTAKCHSSNGADISDHTSDLAALLRAALDEPTDDSEGSSITKREAIVAGLVDRSIRADLQATKLLVELLGKIQTSAGAAAPDPLDAADEKVVATVLSRLGMAE